MRYIVYGAGKTGHKALFFLGYFRVFKFVDNNKAGTKAGTIQDKIDVISYKEMIELYESEKDIIVVIASEKYWKEMEQQICGDGLKRYFVFHENDLNEIEAFLPSYWLYHHVITLSYLQSLSKFHMVKYQYIVIYGTNRFLPYLIAEVMEQSPLADIKIVFSDKDNKDVNTLGFDIIDFDLCMDKMDCLILNVKHSEDPIRKKISAMHAKFDTIDLSEMEIFESAYQHKENAIYKGIHKGKRIFVIGNGPSLLVDDLNKLHENKEICIGVNRIYKVYNRTEWRADYIGIGDLRGLCYEDIFQLKKKVFLADHDLHIPFTGSIYDASINYFHQLPESFYPNHPRFSDDLTKGFFSGATIIYDFGIQMAAYMGAREIYLLGVDCDYPPNSSWKETHFIDDYYTEKEIEEYERMGLCASSNETEKIIKQYEAAEIYSKQYGFKIYNATRGGKLEVFERVDFDSLFKK